MVPPLVSARAAYSWDIEDRYYIGVVIITFTGVADDEHHGVSDRFFGYVFAETRGASVLWQRLDRLRTPRMEVGHIGCKWARSGQASFIMSRYTLRQRAWRTDVD